MSLESLVLKYIFSVEHAFKEMEIEGPSKGVNAELVKKILEIAKTYLDDARYYKEEKKLEISLASIAYCEGLLDALKMLGMVKFEWPKRKEEK